MLKRFTNNLPAKIVCLILAFGLWTYVVSGESKVDTFPGSIPLEVRNKPENLVVVKNVNDVQIKITSDQATWKKLSSSSFAAYIDLSGLAQGTHEVPIHALSNMPNVQIVEIKPATIMISMEPVITKSVSIKEKIEGNAADGMMATDVNLDPKKADVSGPESIISQISQAYGVIVLNGEDSDFTKAISLKAFDDQGKEYDNISFDPKETQVKVTISKAAQTKTVGIKVKTDGRVASGFWVNQITTDPTTVTLSGQSANLANISYIETKSISIDGLNSSKSQTVSLEVPEGIDLVDVKNGKVNVDLSITAIDSTKEVNIAYNYNNLNSNLKVSNVDSTSIKVILSGKSDKLSTLDASQIKVNLDLLTYSLPGIFALDIKDSMIAKPDGINVISFMPSSIRVTLENK